MPGPLVRTVALPAVVYQVSLIVLRALAPSLPLPLPTSLPPAFTVYTLASYGFLKLRPLPSFMAPHTVALCLCSKRWFPVRDREKDSHRSQGPCRWVSGARGHQYRSHSIPGPRCLRSSLLVPQETSALFKVVLKSSKQSSGHKIVWELGLGYPMQRASPSPAFSGPSLAQPQATGRLQSQLLWEYLPLKATG